jgi:membrane protein DedA with SNARE-associated domain
MTDIASLIARHGYALVFGIVLAESIGLPVPAALALVAAGAAAGSHVLRTPMVLAAAMAGTVLGDVLLFFIGRYSGWGFLGFLCRLSVSPETCILRSAESFYKRGKLTLVFAKFVPGINTMAPPLAGSMRMRFGQFLQFDVLGALVYTSTYIGLGYLGRDFLQAITQGVATAGHTVGEVLLVAAVVYVAYRVWLFQKFRLDRVVPRVQVQELIEKLRSEEGDKIIVADVRSHGYYDAQAARIKGSIRIEPNNLEEELKGFPREKDVYLYCT